MTIQWAWIALVAVVLATTTAHAQQIHDPVTRQYLSSRGAILYDENGSMPDSHVLAAVTVMQPPPAVVMLGGKGGSIPRHIQHFGALARSGAPVEMRGGCWSACTLITAHIPKEKLCFAPGSFLAFHAATWTPKPPFQIAPAATRDMYQSYPVEVKQWIDRHGGYEKLTTDVYWTMYDRDLWAIGYPRCK